MQFGVFRPYRDFDFYCYCWYSNGELPSPLPSDVHAYSANHQGIAEVFMALNEADGDCYQFFLHVVDTKTHANMPTISPSLSPSRKPTTKPIKKPTEVRYVSISIWYLVANTKILSPSQHTTGELQGSFEYSNNVYHDILYYY
jgi:hypothetical protein